MEHEIQQDRIDQIALAGRPHGIRVPDIQQYLLDLPVEHIDAQDWLDHADVHEIVDYLCERVRVKGTHYSMTLIRWNRLVYCARSVGYNRSEVKRVFLDTEWPGTEHPAWLDIADVETMTDWLIDAGRIVIGHKSYSSEYNYD